MGIRPQSRTHHRATRLVAQTRFNAVSRPSIIVALCAFVSLPGRVANFQDHALCERVKVGAYRQPRRQAVQICCSGRMPLQEQARERIRDCNILREMSPSSSGGYLAKSCGPGSVPRAPLCGTSVRLLRTSCGELQRGQAHARQAPGRNNANPAFLSPHYAIGKAVYCAGSLSCVLGVGNL
jgi:hypothetical protein